MPATTTAQKDPPSGAVGPATSGVGGRWLLAGAGATLLGLVAALILTGAAASRQLSDPGALVRWGLPVSLTVHNVSAAAVVGALVFAVVMLPREPGPDRAGPAAPAGGVVGPDLPAEHPAFARVMMLAAAAGAAWMLSAVAVLVLTFSDVAGLPVSGNADYADRLVSFMFELPAGRVWLCVCAAAAVVTTLCLVVRSPSGLALTLVLALLGLVPQVLIGHSSSGADPDGAANSLLLHIIGAALWFGGIMALAAVSGTLGKLTGPVLRRFSALALIAFCAVAGSGVVNASLRITGWNDLFTSSYGQLILAKTAATVVLGSIGYMHRTWIIPRLDSGQNSWPAVRVLWQLILVELVIMGSVSGIAVALSRSAPPQPAVPGGDTPPAAGLAGYPLPPEPALSRWFTEWRIDWLWLAFVLAAAAVYLAGVRRLRLRGTKWPAARTVAWLFGMLALAYITSGGPAVYGRVLFSAHLVYLMGLVAVVPLFMVLGAPVPLALQTLRPRDDGSRGVREWILAGTGSRFWQAATNPLAAAGTLAGSLMVFHYSGLFGFALENHLGHELMSLYFTITGCLFVLAMTGSPPVPRPAPYPLRLVLLLAMLAFHAYFGLTLMDSGALLGGDYFDNAAPGWGVPAIADQQTGGAIAWAIGEVPAVLIAIGATIQWARTEETVSANYTPATGPVRGVDADHP